MVTVLEETIYVNLANDYVIGLDILELPVSPSHYNYGESDIMKSRRDDLNPQIGNINETIVTHVMRTNYVL